MQITQKIIPKSLWGLKCPHSMTPEYITIHNTANTASALQEVNYLKNNSAATSCHIFVDEYQVIQCLPLNRNGWHAGDGVNGTGNRRSIGIEICRSTDYTTERHRQAMLNAAEVVCQLRNLYNIPVDHVVQHNYWTGKNCPHRIREEGIWEWFLFLCADKSAEEEENMRIINYKGGNTVQRKLPTGFLVYAKKGITPHAEFKEFKYEGSDIHVARIWQSDDLQLIPYYNETPVYVTQMKNDWMENNGFELILATSGGYFDNHPSASTYGMPVGGLFQDWSGKWSTYKGNELLPAKGKGYPMLFTAGGSDFNLEDCWESDLKDRLANYWWGVAVGQALTYDGKVDCSIGSENGRYSAKESVLMIGIGKDGEWILACNTGVELNHLTRAYLMDSLGAIKSADLDGGGSTHMRIEESKFNSYKSEPTPDPEPEPTPEPKPEVTETMVFECTKASTSKGYPLRKEAPSGEIVKYMKVGDRVKVVDIQNKGKNQYTSAAEPWCLTDYGLWFAYDKDFFE